MTWDRLGTILPAVRNLNYLRPVLSATCLAALLAGTPANAADDAASDPLLDKLVQKGILTSREAQELRREAPTAADNSKLSFADWVEKVRFGGDIRVRMDSINGDDPSFVDRTRYRFRARFGVELDLANDLEVGVRLTTSDGGNPISQNVTFAGNADKKGIAFDEVYLQYAPLHHGDWKGSIVAGKFNNPLHFPSTILYDKDYTPEGFSQVVSYDLNDNNTISVILTEYILDELKSSSRNPWQFGGQVRWDATWSSRVKSSIGAAGFSIMHPESLTVANVPYIGQGNTRTAGGALVNNYDVFYGDAGLTYTFDSAPLYRGKFPLYAYGNAIYNFGASDQNVGYGVGVRFGKASKRGQWELNYLWTHMEADAWWDQFVESDFGAVWTAAPAAGKAGYFSGTNVEGHWIKGTYAIFDQWSVSVAYFITGLIQDPNPAVSNDTTRLFVETVVKY